MTLRSSFLNPAPEESLLTLVELESLLELQSEILGATVISSEVDPLLERLCVVAELLSPGSVASIMLYKPEREQLFVHTAPSIPEAAINDLNGLQVGEGSCGNAIFHNEEMFVCDTFTDSRWLNLQDFASTYNLRSCWSHPIVNGQGDAIGSFALSGFTTGAPSNFQRRLLRVCTFIVGIIFQRKISQEQTVISQRQLEASEKNLAVTIDSIADGVITTDLDGNVVVFNQVAEKLTEQSSVNVLGKHIDSVFKLFDLNGRKLDCNSINKHSPDVLYTIKDDVVKLVVPDGGERYLSISETLINDSQGRIYGNVIAFRDLTEQRTNQVKLTKSQQQNYSIIENLGDALFLHDDLGKVINVNQSACDSLGYTREELLGLCILDVEKNLPDFPDFTQFTASLEFDNTITVDGIHQRKDHSQFPVEVRLRRFLSDDQPLTIAVVRDMTDRIKAEEEQLRSRKLESIGLLAGGIAHDFNNLLGIIQGYTDLANRSLTEKGKSASYLDKADDALKRAAELTQQLLTFSKGGDPIKKTADISEIIHQSIEFSLHGSNVTVDLQICNDLWTINIDTGQISQVMQNLVINARQAMSEGGVLLVSCENTEVDSRINHQEIAPGKYIRVRVEDSGQGIPQEFIDDIFDPYFTTKQQGSGLGLALSYSIVKKHSGYMSVNSVMGKGTTFTIYLPASEQYIADEKQQKPLPGKKWFGKVMVMDDDEMMRSVSSEMLKNLGYEVTQACNGEEALQYYKMALGTNNKIDVIVMDLTITNGMGGKDAMQQMLQIDPQVKVLVSSGYSTDPVMANYEEYGFSGALSKPYKQNELESALCSVIFKK